MLNPANYNTHPEGHVDKLSEILKTNGWRRPVVISNLSGMVVKGHGVALAAIKMGDTLPVSYQDYATANDETQDMIADNMASLGNQQDDAALSVLLEGLGGLDVTPAAIGLNEKEMGDLWNELHPPPPTPASKEHTPPSYTIAFDSVEQAEVFHGFLRRLQGEMPDLESVGARLEAYIRNLTDV